MPANPNYEGVLPAAPEMFSRWAAFQTWWDRSNKEKAQIAEARLLTRMQFFSFKGVNPSGSTEQSATTARVGLVELSGKNRAINTLIIQNRSPSKPSEETLAKASDDTLSSQQETGVADDQGRTPFAQTKLDIKVVDSEGDSMIDPPAPGEKVLVMCHGYGAGLGFFFRNYLSLSQLPGYKIYAIDWLGMGGSSRPEFNFKHSPKTPVNDVVKQAENFFLDALEEWREKQQIEKMTLLGHSLGGYLSAVYALKYPDRVEKLILVSPAGIPESPEAGKAPLPPPPTQTQSEPSSRPSSPTGSEGSNGPQQPRQGPPGWLRRLAIFSWERNITPQSIMRFVGPLGPSLVASYTSRRFAHLEEDEQKDLNSYIYHISSKSGSGEYALSTILAPGAYARWPLMDRLKDLAMPTVFMYGVQDWMDWRAGEKARRGMTVPTAMIRVPEAGHHLYLDNPPAFDKAVIQAITRPWDGNSA
ncbi:hypothetical protein DFQ27_005876 [Actinomortierella ambigua]|uniref:AB hydrolase-1 domain-containing protein n=1 Tax=Actinomortierella ambigua TaxID=1343610 RepID=A0A9P6PZ41_9FUNG|nr:hypothetical protein DFQ27_005876 [Actinomortierella ambigua]